MRTGVIGNPAVGVVGNNARWGTHGDDWPVGHRPCTTCGKMLPFDCFHKHAQCKHGVNTVCRGCRTALSKAFYARTNLRYRLWHRAKTRASKKGVKFDITIEDIVIPTVCPVLGIPLRENKSHIYDDSYSLDRLDPLKGYVRGNICVISARANRLKSAGTVHEIRAVLAYMIEQGLS